MSALESRLYAPVAEKVGRIGNPSESIWHQSEKTVFHQIAHAMKFGRDAVTAVAVCNGRINNPSCL
jgi:hypothetical protein